MNPVGRWWRRRSLRARLTAAATAVIAVTLGTAAVLLVVRLHAELVDRADTNARQEVAEVIAVLSATEGDRPPTLGALDTDDVIEVVDARGQVVAHSANLSTAGRLFAFTPEPGHTEVRSAPPPPIEDPADSYRVAATNVTIDDKQLTVYAGVSGDDATDTTQALAAVIAVGLPLLVAGLAAVTWWLVGRALRPYELLQKRQREFVADAAHELRSPLASLRTQLQVAAEQAAAPDLRDELRGMDADAARLSSLVDDLLQLARLDAHAPLRVRSVDLDDIVLAESRRFPPSPSLDVSNVSAGQVLGDESALTRVVRNLLENAVRHADGKVRVAIQRTGAEVVLTVADDGPGIPAPERARVFERFTRLDQGRGRDHGGTGLGLAIVHEVVTAHGGTVLVRDTAGGHGATFEVRLPSASPNGDRSRAERSD